MDRISNLPDGVISHILSFLSTDEAASTSLLSKRWRHMFAFSPNLQFTFHDPKKWNSVVHQRNFIDFVDRVLALSGNSAVRRFTLDCPFGVGSSHSPDLNRWIHNMLSRGGISHLHINDISINFQDSLLFQILSCKTLVNLTLGAHFEIPMLPEFVSLPALKSLLLYRVTFYNLCAFKKLISACPLLEDLTMDQIYWELWEWSHILSTPSLKRLTINSFSDILGSMSFDHPNLVYLCYSDFVQLKYPVVNLDSLVEAKLDIVTHGGDSLSLIEGLKNVKILNLACPETVEIFMDFSEAMPVFKNLIHLSITTDAHRIGFSYLPPLLKKFPNLQTLVIQGLVFDDDDDFCESTSRCSCLVSCGVKVLEVTKYKGSIMELEVMKRFLEELSCLELVKVCAFAEDDKQMLSLTKDLLMLSRASSKCKIQIKSVET